MNQKIIKRGSLSLVPNSFSLVVGKNGAGKSTLLKIISGFDFNDSGQILFQNEELTKPIYKAIEVSYMPDFMPFEDNAVAGNVIDLIADLNFVDDAEKQKWIMFFQLDLLLGQKIKTLSKGEGQRLKLVCAFLKKFELLVLDEPLVGLDSEARRKTKAVLQEFSTDKMVVVSSHLRSYFQEICDQIIEIEDGMANRIYDSSRSVKLIKDAIEMETNATL